jgi:hypothetical protein
MKMGTDRDGDQAERDVREWFESGDRGLPEEIESGAPDEYAAHDLASDAGQPQAARYGAEEDAGHEDHGKQKKRLGVVQRFQDWIHKRRSLVLVTRDQPYPPACLDSRRASFASLPPL